MKASLYMATYNKNELLPNTLYSIARQKVPFPLEVCIIDDCSSIDPEPIIRQFIPEAKYKRFDTRQGFDVVTSYALDLASIDSDVIIFQSADVIHCNPNTIERLCEEVGEKIGCMATVRDTFPPHDMYKSFGELLPKIFDQWNKGKFRSYPNCNYFFLGALRIEDYKSLKCITEPYCDIMLADELIHSKIRFKYPKDILGFHQPHGQTTIPCTRLNSCKIKQCSLRNRCKQLGYTSFEDYLKKVEMV